VPDIIAAIPWLVVSAVKFIEENLNLADAIFEWGSGGSTLWFARRAKEIISVEHNIVWYKKIKDELPPNAKYIYAPPDREYQEGYESIRLKGKSFKAYASVIDSLPFFDWVIIDGRARVACAKHAVSKFRRFLVLDDAGRKDYEDIIKMMKGYDCHIFGALHVWGRQRNENLGQVDMPFLSIVTRNHPRVPDLFEKCKASVEMQKDRDFQHLVLHDEEGRGLLYANRMLFKNRHLVTGKYVFILDSDDVLTTDTFVGDMKRIAKENKNPGIIFIRMLIDGELFPKDDVWKKDKMIKDKIGTSNFVVLNELWQKNIRHFGIERCGDFNFINTVFSKKPTVYWQR